MARERNSASIVRTFRLDNVHHLRDHISCAANDHFVTNAQTQTFNFIGIVQSRITHQHARNLHRFETCNRGDRSRPPNLELHVANKRHLLLRREFKSHRPARRAGDKA